LWDDPRDAEINEMMLAIPKDRNGLPPAPARIFGSLPTADLQAITIPGLSADLEAVYAAWQDGTLERTRSWIERMTLQVGAVLVAQCWLEWWCGGEGKPGNERLC
jgi:hypothetical protein